MLTPCTPSGARAPCPHGVSRRETAQGAHIPSQLPRAGSRGSCGRPKRGGTSGFSSCRRTSACPSLILLRGPRRERRVSPGSAVFPAACQPGGRCTMARSLSLCHGAPWPPAEAGAGLGATRRGEHTCVHARAPAAPAPVCPMALPARAALQGCAGTPAPLSTELSPMARPRVPCPRPGQGMESLARCRRSA